MNSNLGLIAACLTGILALCGHRPADPRSDAEVGQAAPQLVVQDWAVSL